MVFATEGFFKVAIESYTESDLSTRSLYSVLTDVLTDWANRLWVQVELRTNFVQLPQFHLLFSSRFLLGYCQNVLLSLKFCTANHMNICEYIDTCIDIDTDVYIYNWENEQLNINCIYAIHCCYKVMFTRTKCLAKNKNKTN